MPTFARLYGACGAAGDDAKSVMCRKKVSDKWTEQRGTWVAWNVFALMHLSSQIN